MTSKASQTTRYSFSIRVEDRLPPINGAKNYSRYKVEKLALIDLSKYIKELDTINAKDFLKNIFKENLDLRESCVLWKYENLEAYYTYKVPYTPNLKSIKEKLASRHLAVLYSTNFPKESVSFVIPSIKNKKGLRKTEETNRVTLERLNSAYLIFNSRGVTVDV